MDPSITPQDQFKNILEDLLRDPKTFGNDFEETQRKILTEIDHSRQAMKTDNQRLQDLFQDQLRQLQNEQEQDMENKMLLPGFGDPKATGTFGRGHMQQPNKMMMQMSDIFYNMLNVLG